MIWLDLTNQNKEPDGLLYVYKLCVQHNQINQSSEGPAFCTILNILNPGLKKYTKLKFLCIKVLKARLIISEYILAGSC